MRWLGPRLRAFASWLYWYVLLFLIFVAVVVITLLATR
jgi:hypothetical protein